LRKISFHDFKIVPGSIDFICKVDETKEINLYFRFNRDFIPRNEIIAIALSTLCGTVFKEVYIDLPISNNIKEIVESYTQSKVYVPNTIEVDCIINKGKNFALSYSGGFDSLAALFVLPKKTKLISIDFGDKYQRETEFFVQIEPNILHTNIRQHGLEKNAWTYMALGVILYVEYLDIGYHSFGTVLEELPLHFMDRYIIEKNTAHRPLSHIDVNYIQYTQGITEIGTAMIIAHHRPDLVNSSFISLSDPGAEKLYMKKLILDILINKHGYKIEYDQEIPPPHNANPFGTVFKNDFLALYMIKYLDFEAVSLLVPDIPNDAVELSKSLSLDFYEKFNRNFYNSVPESVRGVFFANLNEVGIYPYNSLDWDEFDAVLKFLRKYYQK